MEMQKYTWSLVTTDVTLTFFPFHDDRKDVAGAIIDFVMFEIFEILQLS